MLQTSELLREIILSFSFCFDFFELKMLFDLPFIEKRQAGNRNI